MAFLVQAEYILRSEYVIWHYLQRDEFDNKDSKEYIQEPTIKTCIYRLKLKEYPIKNVPKYPKEVQLDSSDINLTFQVLDTLVLYVLSSKTNFS